MKCADCIREAVPDRKRCAHCLELGRARRLRFFHLNRAVGKCADCCERVVAGSCYCERHRALMRARKRTDRSKELHKGYRKKHTIRKVFGAT